MLATKHCNEKRRPTTPAAHEFLLRRERIAARIAELEWRFEKIETRLKRLAKNMDAHFRRWETPTANELNSEDGKTEAMAAD